MYEVRIKKYVDFTIHPVLTISLSLATLCRRHDGRGSEDSDAFAITLIGSTDSDIINKPCQECASTGPGTYVKSLDYIVEIHP